MRTEDFLQQARIVALAAKETEPFRNTCKQTAKRAGARPDSAASARSTARHSGIGSVSVTKLILQGVCPTRGNRQ